MSETNSRKGELSTMLHGRGYGMVSYKLGDTDTQDIDFGVS